MPSDPAAREVPEVPEARGAAEAADVPAEPAAAAASAGAGTPRRRDAHCSTCGAPYPATAAWPRTCTACGHTAYRNPLPVAVCLLPVQDADGTGLVVIRRTIRPALGTLALPGGFVEVGETWQQATARELGEETGITARADDVRLADALTDTDGGYLLLFGLLPPRPLAELPPSAPTDETEGYELLRAPAELGFPLHTLAARRWFGGNY
ncbi:NUDIX domain-containing protein [Streptomyces sp. CA2R106]|uniref:NUDIX domain-containing protein n=1 Tax=Streptomyces sp. CA2R106 TaxID=3120153 RepID=UPI00300A4E38